MIVNPVTLRRMPVPAADRATADESRVLEERADSEGLLLALLGQQAMQHLRAAHAATGLSPRQFHVLGLLHDQGALTQHELGGTIGVAASILVTLLNPLEADGYISRDRDPTDRRRHVVSLTPAGENQLVTAATAQREAEDELFRALSNTQRTQLRKLLRALRDDFVADPQRACAAADSPEHPAGTTAKSREETS